MHRARNSFRRYRASADRARRWQAPVSRAGRTPTVWPQGQHGAGEGKLRRPTNARGACAQSISRRVHAQRETVSGEPRGGKGLRGGPVARKNLSRDGDRPPCGQKTHCNAAAAAAGGARGGGSGSEGHTPAPAAPQPRRGLGAAKRFRRADRRRGTLRVPPTSPPFALGLRATADWDRSLWSVLPVALRRRLGYRRGGMQRPRAGSAGRHEAGAAAAAAGRRTLSTLAARGRKSKRSVKCFHTRAVPCTRRHSS